MVYLERMRVPVHRGSLKINIYEWEGLFNKIIGLNANAKESESTIEPEELYFHLNWTEESNIYCHLSCCQVQNRTSWADLVAV